MQSVDNSSKQNLADNTYSYANKPIKVANPFDYSILLVGGSSNNLSISCDVFISVGCKCAYTTSTTKAIDILLKMPVDLVILSSGFTMAMHKIRKFSSVTILSILSKNALEIGGCELTLRTDDDNYDRHACKKILFILQEYRDSFQFAGATKCKNIYINLDSYEAYISNKKIPLKPMEMRILFYLIKHKNRVVNKRVFTSAIWNHQEDFASRTVDVHLMDLRKVLAKHGAKINITTLRNIGIRLLENDITL